MKPTIVLPSLENQIKISKVINKINSIVDKQKKQLSLSVELVRGYFQFNLKKVE